MKSLWVTRYPFYRNNFYAIFSIFTSSLSIFVFTILQNSLTAQQLTCRFEYTTYVWGEHIDYLQWSCNIGDDSVETPLVTNMESEHFDGSQNYENVTSMHIIRTTNTSIPAVHKFSNLTSLRVEFTDFHSLSKEGSKGLENVKNLYLGNNMITDIAEGSFDNLTQIRLLYLNGNQLQKLSESTFNKLTNLERLWLNDNHLTQLHLQLSSENQNLKRVYLQNNKLMVIAKETFNITNLEVVDLRGNICINKWTFDTPLAILEDMAGRNCNPSAENTRKAAIFMAKIIHELSLRDLKLHGEIAAQKLEIYALKEKLKHFEDSPSEEDY